ncbi:MAG: lipopolysaccharide biosynthesis protein [Bacteroides sp.]|nr:lipopolysaccharide biosynthesis protein [Alistipes timonensis]MCM1310985.1 lipopolysaccharide biosynthesis protein [Bacteroides sp.]MCM1405152.1 lipopolysaccharide biosynthesis protein [[Clostridium] fimetarium]
MKSKAVKGVAWSFVGNIANKVIQFVISMILARLLTPSDYGLIGMLGFFIGIASTFIDSGFSSALIQYKDRRDEDYCTVFYVNFGMSLVMYGLLYLCAPLIAEFYDQPILVSIVRVYCLTLVIGALTAINSTRLTIELNYKLSNLIGTAAAFMSGLVGIVCAYSGWGVWALIAQQLAAGVIRGVLLFYYVRWLPGLVFSIKSFKRFFSYGSKLLVSGLIHSAYAQMYPLVIGKQFNAADLGYVTRAQGFNDVAAGTMNNILGSVAFPVLSKIQDDDAKLLAIYDKYIQISAFAVFPLVLFLCGIAKPMILLLLTDKWAPSILLLQILSVGFLWDGIIKINLNLLYVKGRTDLVLRLEIIKKTIAFLILITSVIIGNLYMFCIGMSVYGTIALYLNTIYTKKLLNFGFVKQMRQIRPYLETSVVIMLVALFFSWIVPNNLLSLFISTVVCVPLYFTICYYRRLYALAQAVDIIAPRLGKFGVWIKSKVS